MLVPLLDLTAQYAPLRHEILAAITRVCDSQRFILGPEVDAFEQESPDRLGVGHAIAVSSGTDALLAVLMALGIGPGDEVITPTYSFFATAGWVTRLGATPVFVDIDPGHVQRRPGGVRPRPLAAHARDSARPPLRPGGGSRSDPGRRAPGRRAGHRRRGAGDRRDATTDARPDRSDSPAASRSFRQRTSARSATPVSSPLTTRASPPNSGCCAITAPNAAISTRASAATSGWTRCRRPCLRVKLPHLEAWTDARRQNAERYRALFSEFGLDETIVLPVEPAGFRHIYNQFVIRAPRRDALRDHLTSQRHWHGDLLSGAVPSAGMLPGDDRLSGQLPSRRCHGRQCFGAADFRRADARSAAPRRQQHRAVLSRGAMKR